MPYIENEILERLISTMVEGFARVEKKLDHMNRLKECLDGDKFMDNVDLAELLGVSQRTLARYREKGVIRYYCMNENGEEPVPCLRDTRIPQAERKREDLNCIVRETMDTVCRAAFAASVACPQVVS